MFISVSLHNYPAPLAKVKKWEMDINSEECASSPGNVNPTYKEIGNRAECIPHWTLVKVKANLFSE